MKLQSAMLTMVCLSTIFLSACSKDRGTQQVRSSAWGSVQQQQQNTWDRPLVQQARKGVENARILPTQTLADLETMTQLDELVAFGLERHPRVHAELAELAASANRVNAKGSLPPPTLSLSPIGDMAQTASGEVLAMASISQQFPAWGSLSAEVALAEAAVNKAESVVLRTRVQLAADIRAAWWSYQTARVSIEILREQRALLTPLNDLITQRIRAGGGSQADALRLQLAVDRITNQLRNWESNQTIAAARLRRALSVPEQQVLPDFTATPPKTMPARTALLDRAAHLRPELQTNNARMAVALASQRAANAQRRPAFGVSANYSLVDNRNNNGPTSGDDQWWLGVSLSLPIWLGSYQAADAAADHMKRAATLDRLAIHDQIRADVDMALAQWSSAYDQLDLTAGLMAERAQTALAAEQKAYGAGAGDFLTVIEAWQQLLGIQLMTARLQHDVGIAEAALLTAVGAIQRADISTAQKHQGAQP